MGGGANRGLEGRTQNKLQSEWNKVKESREAKVNREKEIGKRSKEKYCILDRLIQQADDSLTTDKQHFPKF